MRLSIGAKNMFYFVDVADMVRRISYYSMWKDLILFNSYLKFFLLETQSFNRMEEFNF